MQRIGRFGDVTALNNHTKILQSLDIHIAFHLCDRFLIMVHFSFILTESAGLLSDGTNSLSGASSANYTQLHALFRYLTPANRYLFINACFPILTIFTFKQPHESSDFIASIRNKNSHFVCFSFNFIEISNGYDIFPLGETL